MFEFFKKVVLQNATMKPKLFNTLETGKRMTAWDWFYDFNVMYMDFSEDARNRLCKNYYWIFN